LVAPSAYDASFISLGTDVMASSAILIIVGSAIIPRRQEAVKAVSPTGMLKSFCISGATTTMPKNP